ncbi:MAG: Rnase Y domain-containing protein, partial [Marinirhabdus sp.]
MDNTIILYIALAFAGILIGFVAAKFLEGRNASKMVKTAKKNAVNILKEANTTAGAIKKDKILQAKEKFLELKTEHEKVINTREKKMADAEKRTRDKESQVSSELAKNKKMNAEVGKAQADYDNKLGYLDKKKNELEKLHRKQIEQLEAVSTLSAEDAKQQLMESLKEEARTNTMAYIQN